MKSFSISFIAICLSTLGYAQNFKLLSIQGDSLVKQLKFEKALKVYSKAIDLVLEEKEIIADEEFFSTLYSAAETASRLEGKTQSFHPLAKKYWSMLAGSRGEKIGEKISFLKELGVKDLIVYHPHGGHVSVYVSRGCTSNITKYLIWINGSKTYVQRFEECQSYKPLLITNSLIAEYFPKNKQIIATENLNRIKRTNHMGIYDLTFIDDRGAYYQTTYYEFDLLNPDTYKNRIQNKRLDKDVHNYKRNLETKLSKLIPMLEEGVDRYRASMSTGKEREMIGKF